MVLLASLQISSNFALLFTLRPTTDHASLMNVSRNRPAVTEDTRYTLNPSRSSRWASGRW